MKKKRKVFGFLLLLAFLIGIAGVIFLMSVVNSVSKVAGRAGEKLALTDTLRYSLRLYRNLDDLSKDTYFSDLNEKNSPSNKAIALLMSVKNWKRKPLFPQLQACVIF